MNRKKVIGTAMLSLAISIVAGLIVYAITSYDFDSGNGFNPNIKLVEKFGSKGSGDKQFSTPNGIAINKQEHIYVSDQKNNRIQIFDLDGNPVGKITEYGKDEKIKFQSPHGITIDKYDNIYVADSGHNKIVALDHNGEIRFEFGSFCNAVSGKYCYDPDEEGPLKTGDGQFHSPYGIAVDTNDNIYITDVESSFVQKFDKNGKFLNKWGGSGSDYGEFLSTHGIAVDTNDLVYVADKGNNRIQVFDSDGEYKKSFENHDGKMALFDEPQGITFDKSSNQLYITNSGEKHNFVVLTINGALVEKFGSKCDMGNDQGCKDFGQGGQLAKGDLQFNNPQGIAVDQHNRIYVTDGFNHRIQVFEIHENPWNWFFPAN